MSRSLPLEDPSEAIIAPAPGDEPSLPGSVEVFDPAMCCSTGVCGPGVDPALLVIARDIRWLQKHGTSVTRAGLAQQPEAFTAS